MVDIVPMGARGSEEEWIWFTVFSYFTQVMNQEPLIPAIEVTGATLTDVNILQCKFGYSFPIIVYHQIYTPATTEGRRLIFEATGWDLPLWAPLKTLFDVFPLEVDVAPFADSSAEHDYNLIAVADYANRVAGVTRLSNYIAKILLPILIMVRGIVQDVDASSHILSCLPWTFNPARGSDVFR